MSDTRVLAVLASKIADAQAAGDAGADAMAARLTKYRDSIVADAGITDDEGTSSSSEEEDEVGDLPRAFRPPGLCYVATPMREFPLRPSLLLTPCRVVAMCTARTGSPRLVGVLRHPRVVAETRVKGRRAHGLASCHAQRLAVSGG